ncbi:MAG: hypothetical protein AAGD12_08230 [Pseudomonadota bacterium]
MDTMPQFVAKAARLCRSVAAMLIAGVLRRLDSAEVEARLAARPRREQITVTALVLIALFLAALLAAQGGVWGMLAFGALVVFLGR